MSRPPTTLLDIFTNAWWVAVDISHNRKMECLNNPTPEVTCEMVVWETRLRRLRDWSVKRWGVQRVAKNIHQRQYQKLST